MAVGAIGPAEDSAERDPAKRLEGEVTDARRLLDFAVETGWGAADGRRIDDKLILAIKQTEDAVAAKEAIPVEQRVKFERAYLDLAALLAPITARSLKDTSSDPHDWTRSWLLGGMSGSEATIWSRKLMAITIIFLVVIFLGDVIPHFWGQVSARLLDDGTQRFSLPFLLQVLFEDAVPFTYGGLGACTCLLRSLSEYIYKRTFDANRRPEYINRILLGFVAGGAVTLFVAQVPEGEDASATIQLSAKALGFLVGYNTDFLFSTLERVAAAVLPKVGLGTVRREEPRAVTPMAIQDVSLNELLNKYAQATDPEEKALYRSLIERLQTRI